MTVVVNSRPDFTLENYRRVAADGEGVVIGDLARAVMADHRAAFVELLASDRTAFMYGVTSRPGLEVKVAVPPEEQAAWATGSEMLGTGRGFGGGYLDERVIRGIVFARLADFVEGTAKARPMIAERVAAMLDGPLPRVPIGGQVGAGEILPMMHVMSRVDTSDFHEGEWMTLVNGSPCSAALIADTALHARHRLEIAQQIFALSVEALRAPLDAYDPELDSLWGDQHEAAALRGLRSHLDLADTSGRLAQQAPVSYRILPRVLGQVHRAVGGVEHAARVSLSSAAHNPVYLPPDNRHPHGRLFSTGGYHNAMAYPALNAMTVGWADLALVAERHIICLHSSEVSELPHFLAPPGIPGAATNLFGWVASGYVEGAREAATPTLLPACVNDARDDVSSPTFLGYGKERRGAACLDSVLAVLALASSQALFVADRGTAPQLSDFLAGVRSAFPPVDGRPRGSLGTEAGRLAQILSRGALTGELVFDAGPGTTAEAAVR